MRRKTLFDGKVKSLSAPIATVRVVPLSYDSASQWGAADAEIKVPSGENTELKRSPFHAWSRSVYSHTCYAYCQGVLPCLFLPFQSIHLHFFQNLSQFFPVFACRIKKVTLLDAGSRVECPRHINRLKKKHDLWKDDDL